MLEWDPDKYYHVVGWAVHSWSLQNPATLMDIMSTGLRIERTLFKCVFTTKGSPPNPTVIWESTAVLEVDISGLRTSKELGAIMNSTQVLEDIPPERIRVAYMPEGWIIAEEI